MFSTPLTKIFAMLLYRSVEKSTTRCFVCWLP